MTAAIVANVDDHRKSAAESGYTIDVMPLGTVPTDYRHKCGGEPVATYRGDSGGFTQVYATCECGELYLMVWWRA